MSKKPLNNPRFKRRDLVCLKRDRSRWGAIWSEPIPSNTQWVYEVFFSAQEREYIVEDELSFMDGGIHRRSLDNLEGLLRHLALVKLQDNRYFNNLYALYGSRTKFEVYQFKPALKFLGNPDQRLLIADEVGLGKTIEAGIIMVELQARLDLARVLVVCPSALRQKWQDEMRSRFDETFTILDADRMRQFLKDYRRYGSDTRLKGIVSLELIRRLEFKEVLAEDKVSFDLVIIDEAHHCRNTGTLSHDVALVLSDNADAMLLLTATPLHLGNQDLFHLLHILNPGEFDYLEAFEPRLRPNTFINQASRLLSAGHTQEAAKMLRNVEHTQEKGRFLGNPYYREVMSLLQQPALTREQMVTAQGHLLELNTLSHIFTRTRKREVQEKAPIRSAFTLRVPFTPQERQFYNRIATLYRSQTGKNWVSAWRLIMLERQATSCISAVRERIRQILMNNKFIASLEDEDTVQGLVEAENNEPYADAVSPFLLHSLRSVLNNCSSTGEMDTKFRLFVDKLREVLNDAPHHKVLVFSFFRGTLEYLYQQLRRLGVGVQMMHGGIPIVERQKVVEEFRDNPAINVLLSSEVGSEGLDFQFCSTLFNYDLPWNPMKVEQRIGRLDRFGQEHPKIHIYNLVIEDSIEERIYYRLYQRIRIFEQTIGDLEAILGAEIRELHRRLFSSHLTPEEEIALAEQTANNIIRCKQEIEKFEQQRLQFMGQDAIFANQVEQAIESGRFVSEVEIRALVEGFIRSKFPRVRLVRNGTEDHTYSLEPDDDLVQYMRRFIFDSRSLSFDEVAKEFLRQLHSSHIIPLTFSADLALQRKPLQFVHLRHPLTQAAIDYWQKETGLDNPRFSVVIKTEPRFAGDYYFFVFLFHARALEQNTSLAPVMVSAHTGHIESELSVRFLRLVQLAQPSSNQTALPFAETTFEQMYEIAVHYAAAKREQIEKEIQRSNEELVNARLAAINQTFEIKRRTIERYIESATDERILRMRRAQLRNLEAKHARDVQKIESLRSFSVSFKLVFSGMARVESEQSR